MERKKRQSKTSGHSGLQNPLLGPKQETLLALITKAAPAPTVTAKALTPDDHESIEQIEKCSDILVLVAAYLSEPKELSSHSWNARKTAIEKRLLELKAPKHPNTGKFLMPLTKFNNMSVPQEANFWRAPGEGFFRIENGKLVPYMVEQVAKVIGQSHRIPSERKNKEVRFGDFVEGVHIPPSKKSWVKDVMGDEYERDERLIELGRRFLNPPMPNLFYQLSPKNQKRFHNTTLEEELRKRGIK